MNKRALQNLLEKFQKGEVDLTVAMDKLCSLPFGDIGESKIDHHRMIRTGCPEIVYGESKSTSQIINAMQELSRHGEGAFASRVQVEKSEEILLQLPSASYNALGRTLVVEPDEVREEGALVGVLCAGTSDLYVAEECASCLEFLGHPVERFLDIGVAGVHRLLSVVPDMQKCSSLIVMAGMEGALPTVVAGLVSPPVIAVPTSVGYGVSLGGYAALMGMLSTCAPGVSVVNIDNGIGAAMCASRIGRTVRKG